MAQLTVRGVPDEGRRRAQGPRRARRALGRGRAPSHSGGGAAAPGDCRLLRGPPARGVSGCPPSTPSTTELLRRDRDRDETRGA